MQISLRFSVCFVLYLRKLSDYIVSGIYSNGFNLRFNCSSTLLGRQVDVRTQRPESITMIADGQASYRDFCND